jgi:hypothetical protein
MERQVKFLSREIEEDLERITRALNHDDVKGWRLLFRIPQNGGGLYVFERSLS